MTAKSKAPKKAAPKKASVKKPTPNNSSFRHLLSQGWEPFLSQSMARLRIGSIVRYTKTSEVMIVLWYDDNDFERDNEPNPKARYTWGGIYLSDPTYGDFMYVSEKQLEDGEIEIIGHFDFFSLVNGNNNR